MYSVIVGQFLWKIMVFYKMGELYEKYWFYTHAVKVGQFFHEEA